MTAAPHNSARCHRWKARDGEPTWRQVFRAVWRLFTRRPSPEERDEITKLSGEW